MPTGTEARNTLLTLGVLPLGLALVAALATSLDVQTIPDHVLTYLLVALIAAAAFFVVKERVTAGWPAVVGLVTAYLAIGTTVTYLPGHLWFIAPAQCFSIAAALGFGALSGWAFRRAQAARSLWSFALAIVVSGAAAGYATFPQANVMAIRQERAESIRVAFAEFNRIQDRWAGERSEAADLERWKGLRNLALAMGHDPLSPSYISAVTVDYDAYSARRAKGKACAVETGDAKAACLRSANDVGTVNAVKEIGPVDILIATLGNPGKPAVVR